ncbi:MAG: DNA polymerase IV [Alphaproteobacteria bacterium]|nr:DNA polymerase IV [Alphaproteobacteria bacterium]|tara:strand:+ start:148 stop:1446 length:1299 start_codon:yes stop_codon:yes gene_type:complete
MTEPTRNPAIALCRNCTTETGADATRCPACGTPRILAHPELGSLAIAHIDCDAFYASVEKRDDPSLRDKPVIVGGGRRGVVSAACYIARIKGVRSAMPMFKALKLCPEATVIRPDMEKYAAVGRQIREMMRDITPLVEPLSIDEAFLDLTGTERLHHAVPAASLIRLVNRVEREIGVTASVGLSYNKFLAKLASDLDKPRGFAVIGKAEALDFLENLPVTRIWGVGAALHRKLTADGLRTIGHIRTQDEVRLVSRYGAIGFRLARFSHGEDMREVTPHSLPKNLSAETTFASDISDMDELLRRLWPLCERVTDRMKKRDLAGRTITLKLKTAAFKTLTRSQALPDPTQLAETLYRGALPLLERAVAAAPPDSGFRLIGVGLSNFADPIEADPLDLADPDAEQRKRVEDVIDEVRGKLGRDAIGKGRAIRPDR